MVTGIFCETHGGCGTNTLTPYGFLRLLPLSPDTQLEQHHWSRVILSLEGGTANQPQQRIANAKLTLPTNWVEMQSDAALEAPCLMHETHGQNCCLTDLCDLPLSR